MGLKSEAKDYLILVITLISCGLSQQKVIHESCYGDICYQVLALGQARNWPGATLRCESQSLEGGAFFDKEVMNDMDNVLRSLGVTAWIGLKIETVYTWRWYDGSPIYGITVAVKRPGNCLLLHNGVLFMDSCNSEYQCLCENIALSRECNARGGLVLDNRCVYDTGTPRIWVECAQRCVAGGGQLATQSIIKNLNLASVTADFYRLPTWIGITKSFIQWVRPSPLDPFILDWANTVKPNPDYQSEHRECAVLGTGSGVATVSCGQKLPHIVCLKAPPKYMLPVPPPRVVPKPTIYQPVPARHTTTIPSTTTPTTTTYTTRTTTTATSTIATPKTKTPTTSTKTTATSTTQTPKITTLTTATPRITSPTTAVSTTQTPTTNTPAQPIVAITELPSPTVTAWVPFFSSTMTMFWSTTGVQEGITSPPTTALPTTEQTDENLTEEPLATATPLITEQISAATSNYIPPVLTPNIIPRLATYQPVTTTRQRTTTTTTTPTSTSTPTTTTKPTATTTATTTKQTTTTTKPTTTTTKPTTTTTKPTTTTTKPTTTTTKPTTTKPTTTPPTTTTKPTTTITTTTTKPATTTTTTTAKPATTPTTTTKPTTTTTPTSSTPETAVISKPKLPRSTKTALVPFFSSTMTMTMFWSTTEMEKYTDDITAALPAAAPPGTGRLSENLIEEPTTPFLITEENTAGMVNGQMEVRTRQTIKVVRTQFPIWVVLGGILGFVLLTLVTVVIVFISLLTRRRKLKKKAKMRTFSTVSTAPPMMTVIDNYGAIGTVDTLGGVSTFMCTDRHSLASIPDHVTIFTEPSLMLDTGYQIQEEFTYPSVELEFSDHRYGNTMRSNISSVIEHDLPPRRHSVLGADCKSNISNSTYDKLDRGYDHQHSLHTKKQKRTQYQLGHKEHHSLPYNAYADVYTDLPCNMMDYGKDQAKKRRSKKTKKSHR